MCLGLRRCCCCCCWSRHTQVFFRLIEKAIVCLEQAPATAHIGNRCAGGEAGEGRREGEMERIKVFRRKDNETELTRESGEKKGTQCVRTMGVHPDILQSAVICMVAARQAEHLIFKLWGHRFAFPHFDISWKNMTLSTQALGSPCLLYPNLISSGKT